MGHLLPHAPATVFAEVSFQAVAEPRAEEAGAFTEPLSGEVFLPVPGGRFQMGGKVHSNERPIHWVRLSAFWLAKTPVTNRQYRQFIEATSRAEPPLWRERRFSAPAQPVVGVTWHDAMAYCEWLTRQSPPGQVFELPTEAQWEFAARGTDGREYPWDDTTPDAKRACFDQDPESGQPAEVGSYPAGAGPFGHLDLAGNVWEWCRDLWEPNYKRWADEEPLDPIGEADADFRPLRGGAWWFDATNLRSTCRSRFLPGFRFVGIGFRVSCAPSSKTPQSAKYTFSEIR